MVSIVASVLLWACVGQGIYITMDPTWDDWWKFRSTNTAPWYNTLSILIQPRTLVIFGKDPVVIPDVQLFLESRDTKEDVTWFAMDCDLGSLCGGTPVHTVRYSINYSQDTLTVVVKQQFEFIRLWEISLSSLLHNHTITVLNSTYILPKTTHCPLVLGGGENESVTVVVVSPNSTILYALQRTPSFTLTEKRRLPSNSSSCVSVNVGDSLLVFEPEKQRIVFRNATTFEFLKEVSQEADAPWLRFTQYTYSNLKTTSVVYVDGWVVYSTVANFTSSKAVRYWFQSKLSDLKTWRRTAFWESYPLQLHTFDLHLESSGTVKETPGETFINELREASTGVNSINLHPFDDNKILFVSPGLLCTVSFFTHWLPSVSTIYLPHSTQQIVPVNARDIVRHIKQRSSEQLVAIDGSDDDESNNPNEGFSFGDGTTDLYVQRLCPPRGKSDSDVVLFDDRFQYTLIETVNLQQQQQSQRLKVVVVIQSKGFFIDFSKNNSLWYNSLSAPTQIHAAKDNIEETHADNASTPTVIIAIQQQGYQRCISSHELQSVTEQYLKNQTLFLQLLGTPITKFEFSWSHEEMIAPRHPCPDNDTFSVPLTRQIMVTATDTCRQKLTLPVNCRIEFTPTTVISKDTQHKEVPSSLPIEVGINIVNKKKPNDFVQRCWSKVTCVVLVAVFVTLLVVLLMLCGLKGYQVMKNKKPVVTDIEIVGNQETRIQVSISQDIIGRTNTTTVYRATDVATGMTLAVKLFHNGVVIEADEMEYLTTLECPYLVTIYGVTVTSNLSNHLDFDTMFTPRSVRKQTNLFNATSPNNNDVNRNVLVVMQCIPGGSLSTLLLAHPHGLPIRTVVAFTRDIIRGLAYLHSKDLIHGNLSLNNVLLTEAKSCKLVDFVLARHDNTFLCETYDTTQPITSSIYIPPETLTGIPFYTKAGDIWMAGLLALEMATGKRSWCHMDSVSELIQTVDGSSDGSYPIHAVLSGVEPMPASTTTTSSELSDSTIERDIFQMFSDFCHRCLTFDPDKRESAQQLLHHPCMNATITP